eukprot:SAG11_NODE_4387_length_1919_cov_1.137363_4_plen_194_part_01
MPSSACHHQHDSEADATRSVPGHGSLHSNSRPSLACGAVLARSSIAVGLAPPDVSALAKPQLLYLGAVTEGADGGLLETGSRTAGVVGVAPSLAEAERQAESEVAKIWGPVFHRRDIGTAPSIRQKVEHMRNLRGPRVAILGSTRGEQFCTRRSVFHVELSCTKNVSDAFMMYQKFQHESDAFAPSETTLFAAP